MSKKHQKNNKIKEEMLEAGPLTYLEEWKRERAGFLNYKAEEEERIERAIKFSNEKFIINIIDILDTIYLAEGKLPDDLKENQWVKGTLQIKDQILDFLKINGVEEIDCLNKEFDPNFHEAIDVMESSSESGTIIEEIKKGYLLHSKVIRPSIVRVAK
ncbi:nucleotide exchange factor GrpE [Patescibacteria group bacterium]|nr:nucleotide exchange factor GrpE [Patescibacteria group bacterium]